jgi:hypothetical protein
MSALLVSGPFSAARPLTPHMTFVKDVGHQHAREGNGMYVARRVIAIAASSLVLFGILMATDAVPAWATTYYCGGDVCADVVSKASAGFGIDAWAYTTTFTGHFELISPNGTIYNMPKSGNVANPAGGTSQHFQVPQVDGGYTVIAWKYVSAGNYDNIGEVGFSVHLGR